MGPLWGANKNCTPCGIEHSTARMAPDGPIGVRGPEAPGPSGSLVHPGQIHPLLVGALRWGVGPMVK